MMTERTPEEIAAGRCETCKFRQPDGRPEYALNGWCRRFPPTLTTVATPMGDVHFEREWPWMHPDEWCGEYQPLIEKESRRG